MGVYKLYYQNTINPLLRSNWVGIGVFFYVTGKRYDQDRISIESSIKEYAKIQEFEEDDYPIDRIKKTYHETRKKYNRNRDILLDRKNKVNEEVLRFFIQYSYKWWLLGYQGSNPFGSYLDFLNVRHDEYKTILVRRYIFQT